MENLGQKSPTTTEKSVEAGLSSGKMPIPSTAERLLAVGSITLGNIFFLGGGGWLLDKYFHTKPWFLIAGMVLAFISTQVMIYLRMKKLIDQDK